MDGMILAGWRPEEVAFILGLCFGAEIDEDDATSYVVIRALTQPKHCHAAWPQRDGEWFEVKLRCLGVKDLRVDGIAAGTAIRGFAIEDCSGTDGVSYRVADREQQRISFLCHCVVIESRERVCRPGPGLFEVA